MRPHLASPKLVTFSRVLILGALVAFSGACKKAPPANAPQGGADASSGGDVIKVGEIGSMTGSEATFGMATHKGIELAFNQVNKTGGVKGKKIQLISLDDQGKTEEAATATTKLITQMGVSAVLGEVASTKSLAMAPIAQQNKIPMITPSSTNPDVTKAGDYIFRVCFIDPFQGYVMAKFAHDNLKVTQVAILEDVKNAYSKGLAEAFRQSFTKMGGKIVPDGSNLSYSNGDVNFKAQLSSLKSLNPQAIFVPGYYTDVGLIARQAKELGINAPLLGGDGWDSPKLTEIGGKALNGSYFSNHYSSENKEPRVQDFITQYKAAYGNEVPDGLAAMGYDAARVLVDAMNRAKTLGSGDVRDAIAATKNYAGVTGVISINGERNAIKSAVVLKVQDNEFHYDTTISP